MKKFCLTCLMTFCVHLCHAEITQMNDMKEIFTLFDNADSKTLAVFDVDMVLIQPSDPAFQMPNMKRYSAIAKSIMKSVPADKQMLFLSLMTASSDPILVDDRTPQFLQQIIQKGIPAIALTANLTGQFEKISNMEQWRIEGLRQLGIDFSKAAPCQSSLLFDDLAPYRGNYSAFVKGMLFVNGNVVTKGDAFVSYLEKADFYPNKVIFIDDRDDNLKSLESAIQKLGKQIEYHGIHYTGAQNYPSKAISEKEFESRWQKLATTAKELN